MLRVFVSILCLTVLLVAVSADATTCHAQVAGEVKVAEGDDSKLTISMSEKGTIELQSLVRWLADLEKLTITADTKVFPANVKSEVRFYGTKPIEFNSEAALEIVQSILRTNGLALVDSEVADIRRIVKLADVRPFAPVVTTFGDGSVASGTYATGVFSLEHVKPQEALSYIKQMIYTSADELKNITTIPNRNTLIVTETDDRLVRIAAILKSLDVPAAKVYREFYTVKNVQAIELKQQLDEIFNPVEDVADLQGPQSSLSSESTLKINAIVRTNQLLLSGPRSEVAAAIEIAKQIDVDNNLVLKTHRFTNVSAKRIDDLIRQAFRGMDEDQIKRVYQVDVNEQANELIASTQPQVHTRIEALKKQLDIPEESNSERSPMQFYTLKNVKAIDIVDTLQSIEQRVTDQRLGRNRGLNASAGSRGIVSIGGFIDDRGFRDSNQSGGGAIPGLGVGGVQGFGNPNDTSQGFAGNGPGQGSSFGTSVVGDIARLASGSNAATSVIPGEARITVDENTNTLIIVAEPATQKLYAKLIEKLDVRRPQVLIEVTIVTLTKQDDYNLGIEISGGDRNGDRRLFGFTNFDGGRTVGEDGVLTINPSLGFNGALIDPQTAEVILKALAQHQTARVTAAPRILVNDNATGLLSSTEEVPFQSTTSNSVATSTSVGGFLQAGTTINVTPQISEDDYLNLEFDVLVNDFSGTTSAEGLPPGRSINQVTSTVSIPDGHTVVVGGLSRKRRADDLTGLPLIERIPILNRLTSLEVDSEDESKLFVFIKPVILRDDKFQDLRFLSDEERREASIPDDFPSSNPILIR